MENKGISEGSLREQYLQETERIKSQIGDLEQIRLSLGLSQRKLCQLLMVDPSAWTRWNKSGAPPHVYQSLKWLLELRKVNPEAAGPSNISNRVDFIQSRTDSKFKEIENNVAQLERIVISNVAPPPSPSHDQRIEQEIFLLKQKIETILNSSVKKSKKISRPQKKKSKPKRKPTRVRSKKKAQAKSKAKARKKTKKKKSRR